MKENSASGAQAACAVLLFCAGARYPSGISRAHGGALFLGGRVKGWGGICEKISFFLGLLRCNGFVFLNKPAVFLYAF
jgi:hypothetical protein